jgi:exosortase
LLYSPTRVPANASLGGGGVARSRPPGHVRNARLRKWTAQDLLSGAKPDEGREEKMLGKMLRLDRTPCRPPPAALVGAALAVVLLGLYWPTMSRLVGQWQHGISQCSHGYVAPVLALFLLWSRRKLLLGAPLRPAWWGIPVIVLGVAVSLAGTSCRVPWVNAPSLLVCLTGLCLLLGGWRAFRWSWPALVLLLFLVPPPWRPTLALVQALQGTATAGSTYVLQTLGFVAFAEGEIIRLGQVRFAVSEGCSGVHILLLFVALSTGLVFVLRRSRPEKALVLLGAVPIAVLANLLRISATTVLMKTAGSDAAAAFFHDLVGWLMMPLALALLAFELRLLSWVFVPVSPQDPEPLFLAGRSPDPRTVDPVGRRACLQRAVNPRALLMLLAGAVLLGAGIPLVHGFQVKRNARGLLDEALRLEQDGRPEGAVAHLRLYLDLAPTDTDALARYGSLLGRLARSPADRLEAYLVLGRALSRDDRRQDLRRQTAELAVAVGRFTEAQAHLEVLLEADPADPELLRLRGLCAAGNGRFDEAGKWYAMAVQRAPDRIDLCQEYATLLRGPLKQPSPAEEVMRRLVQANERSLPARLAAAHWYRRAGRWDEVERHIQFALNELQGANDPEVVLLAADLALGRGDAGRARTYLESGVNQHLQDTRLRQELARLELQRGERRKALQYLESSLKALPEQPRELWALGNLLIEAGDLDGAGEVLKRLNGLAASDYLDCLRARLLMRNGAWGEARTVLERVTGHRLPGPDLARQVYLWLGDCYGHLDNPDQRLRAYQRALDSDPESLAARRALAASLAAVGRADQAIAEYRQLLPRTPDVRGPLAELLLAQNLRLPDAERRWTEVEQLLQAMAEGKRPDIHVQLLLAEVLVARGKSEGARRLIEGERDRDRKQVEPWLFLIRLAGWQGRAESVLPLVEEAEREAGQRVEWQLARVRYWAGAEPAQARQLLPKLEADLEHWPDAERERLLEGLAGAYLAVGEVAAAARLGGELAGRQPGNLNVRLVLFEIALQAGRRAEAETTLAEIRRIEGDGGAVTAYGQASLGLLRAGQGDRGALAEAHRLLAEAAAVRPSWSRVPLREAEVYELEGRKDRALEQYLAALDRGAGQLAVYRRAVQLLYDQGRYAEANALLHRLPDQTLAERGLGRLAAQLALAGPGPGDPPDAGPSRQRALQLARRTVAADSKDYRDYLWLGMVAWAAGQPDEAAKWLRRARDLAETAPDAWAALILFLARTDAGRAQPELAAAKRALAADQAPLVLAPCYEALGQPALAEEQYRAALAARPHDPAVLRVVVLFYTRSAQPARAEPVLRALLDPATRAPQAVTAWARRGLAVALAVRGDYRHFQEALALLEDNGKETGEAAANEQAQALVLATQPGRRREALRLLERAAARQAAPPPEVRLALAELYTADGDWPGARDQIVALLAADRDNPAYLARYVRGLLGHGDAEQAEVWVQRLAQAAPATFEIVELRARVLQARGKPEEAVSLLQAYARAKDARPDLAALLLDQLGQPAEAEQMYRAYAAASARPESVLPLVLHLARHGRLAEALDLCEPAWRTCPAEEVAAASMVALRLAHGGAEAQRRVQRWLTAASTAAPRSVRLLALLAELHEWRGCPEEAMAVYRRILELDPVHPVAVNNLAYYLALKEGRQAEALRLISTAIDRAGPAAELLDTRAVIYVRGRQAEPALADLQLALVQAPTAATYFHLAQAQQLAGDRLAAAQALRTAAKLGLKAGQLPPLEQPAFERLAGELARK